MSLASDGTLEGTPTASGASAFTVEARDTFNQTGSQNYTITVTEPAPVAGNVAATVAYGSSANPITLAISGGPATPVAVARPPTPRSARPPRTTTPPPPPPAPIRITSSRDKDGQFVLKLCVPRSLKKKQKK